MGDDNKDGNNSNNNNSSQNGVNNHDNAKAHHEVDSTRLNLAWLALAFNGSQNENETLPANELEG